MYVCCYCAKMVVYLYSCNCGLREICRSLRLVCNQIEQRGLGPEAWGLDPLFTKLGCRRLMAVPIRVDGI